ncbi:hypothetical protein NE237_020902 [Protea cynaroides]|uniref:Uncharacterized protein n=1 Tax=Protea cynaroides TaxID=273540 RepID=A0A9Q0K306_9MAGN|nr:hypothetical protein NE237_020902 [Protea cynaroides]
MARTNVPRVHDPVHFRSNEAEAQYARYARKKVEGGRRVDLASLALFDMETDFGDMGKLPMITYNACTCPDLVRQFYCNLQVVGDHNDTERDRELRITSYVKGVEVSFDCQQLADLLGISHDGPLVYCAPWEPEFFSLEMQDEIDHQVIREDCWEMKAINLRPEPRGSVMRRGTLWCVFVLRYRWQTQKRQQQQQEEQGFM